MKVPLIIKTGNYATRIVVRDNEVTIGRGKSAKLTVKDDLLSRNHCAFVVENNQLYVRDCHSKNGTFLNGIKVEKQRVYLQDTITIGDTVIKIDRMELDEKSLNILASSDQDPRDLTFEITKDQLTLTEKRSSRASAKKFASTKKPTPQASKKQLKLTKDNLIIIIILLSLIVGYLFVTQKISF